MKQILAAALSVSASVLAGPVLAQTDYPERAVRIVIGFPPGGPSDIVARLLGQKFAEAWGKPVIVENVAGAAGNIGADRVAKATPDGYTLGLPNHAAIVINSSLYRLPYDPVRDFAPISQVCVGSSILVVDNTVPAKSVQELVALAKARPGELTFASGGSGNSVHLAGEVLKSMAGIDISHVPYKGVALAMPDLIAGRVTMMFSPISVALPPVRQGKLLHPRGDAVIWFEQGRSVAGLIPGARFVPLESRNHVLLDTEPAWQTFVQALDEFLPAPPPKPAAGPQLPLDELTARESEVLELAAQGLDNGTIAARLGISERTARNHVSMILSKLGISNRAQAIVQAREAGFGRRTTG
jgi:DNA-binding CsgD family transcriptional regulator